MRLGNRAKAYQTHDVFTENSFIKPVLFCLSKLRLAVTVRFGTSKDWKCAEPNGDVLRHQALVLQEQVHQPPFVRD